MRAVAIVAPSFAPSSYPPAIRARFFASHLPAFGWRPIVLTVRSELLGEPQDREFLKLVPESIEIIRTAAIPPKVSRVFGFGDLGLRSFAFHLRALRRLCRHGADAVLIPGPPWYSFCLGPLVASRMGVPYVLDYIDPWVNSQSIEARRLSKAWLAYRAALALEPSAVNGAAAIIAVSEGTNGTVQQRYPAYPADRFRVIPYGFEPSDFEAMRRGGQSPRLEWQVRGSVNACYVGAMLPKAYDTVRALFRALRRVNSRATAVAKPRIQITFLGTTYATGPSATPLVLPVARQEGVEDFVREYPLRIPYLEALRILTSADLLLALGSSEPHYTASKIFPSLLARRPLLALFHESSSVCSILRHTGAGRLITFSDARPVERKVDDIERALAEFLNGDRFGSDGKGPDWLAENFSARQMARSLADVLSRVVKS